MLEPMNAMVKAIAWLAIGTALPLTAAPAEDLKAEVARLRDLLWDSAQGKSYDEIKAADGKSYRGVTITRIEPGGVAFKYSGGEQQLPFSQCPAAWVKSFALVAQTPAADEKGAAFGEVTDAIVVIQGDVGTGTGFFVRTGGKIWLYTAAHVFSGNSRLQVKLRGGGTVKKFGVFQAAEGGDMVRLEVLEEVPGALEAGAASGVCTVGMPIVACGNSGGGGTVGDEAGKVLGVGPESVEIDANVIQGNSGGPVIEANSHIALGVVTHLTAARGDLWAKETRFSAVRRFACRLDREWQWKTLPIEVFLQEGKVVKKVGDQNELMSAALQPDKWTSAIFVQNREDPLAREILSLSAWIEEQRSGGQRFSENDRKKRLRGILQGALHRSRTQMADLKTDGYAWFHRESLKGEVHDREVLDKAFIETAETLR